MPFQFHNADASPYRPGALFMGVSDSRRDIGIVPERHALTVAGARSGKGAAVIVPNLRRWPHSALVIDPKGENAFLTWEARRHMGQAVHILDPFREADIPDSVRASFNPLAAINPAEDAAREDIQVIADGLVIRHKAADGEWYDGAKTVIAGFIAHALTSLPAERHNLAAVRDMLNFPADVFAGMVADMAENPACGGLPQEAAALLGDQTKSGREFLSGARRSISSMGAPALQSCMAESSFRLSDLKAGRCTVFLVLPSRYVTEHARFFRLFVRLALAEMEKPLPNKTGLDRLKGTPCLFMLDEFAELGRIDALQKAAGRMAGNGVHLWPFLQNFRQLHDLYGNEGAEVFISNADALQFFGVDMDHPACRFISDRVGALTPAEIADGPPPAPVVPGKNTWWEGAERARHADAQGAYQHAMRRAGTPRLAPDEIARITGKGPSDKVARSMIVFPRAGGVWNLRLRPYFDDPPVRNPVIERILAEQRAKRMAEFVKTIPPNSPPPPGFIDRASAFVGVAGLSALAGGLLVRALQVAGMDLPPPSSWVGMGAGLVVGLYLFRDMWTTLRA